MRDALAGKELWLAWAVAAFATLGSLFFSEISDFVPCRLCWFQRIAMYPLFVILLVAALRRSTREAFQYAIVFPIVGAGVSIYHLYIEANPDKESAGCRLSAPGGCAVKWIDEFGYITIPALALTAYAAIIALLVLGWSRRGDQA
ncbi:MAG: disulfide bond formation protein B [Actinobacteria bacterium]|nr:disulfide bond formation protein B [Actinomycetota bacterium]